MTPSVEQKASNDLSKLANSILETGFVVSFQWMDSVNEQEDSNWDWEGPKYDELRQKRTHL